MTTGADTAQVDGGHALRLRVAGRDPYRRVYGTLLVMLWVAWVVLTSLNQVRYVTPDRLDDDLAAGRVVAWRVITVDGGSDDQGPWSRNVDYGVPAATEDGEVDRDRTDLPVGREAVVYIVDSVVSRWRVVDPDLVPTTFDTTQRLRAAGVPPGFAVQDPDVTGPPSDAASLAAAPLVLLFLGSVLGGPAPTRGTRWFWFWLTWATLGLGVLAYAVLEQLRPAPPRPPGPGPERRQRGWVGLVATIGVTFVVGAALTGVAGATHWLWVPSV